MEKVFWKHSENFQENIYDKLMLLISVGQYLVIFGNISLEILQIYSELLKNKALLSNEGLYLGNSKNKFCSKQCSYNRMVLEIKFFQAKSNYSFPFQMSPLNV